MGKTKSKLGGKRLSGGVPKDKRKGPKGYSPLKKVK